MSDITINYLPGFRAKICAQVCIRCTETSPAAAALRNVSIRAEYSAEYAIGTSSCICFKYFRLFSYFLLFIWLSTFINPGASTFASFNGLFDTAHIIDIALPTRTIY